MEANVLKDQLQTGKVEKPTILSAVKDSGAADVNFKEGKQADGNVMEEDAERCQGVEYSNTKCHQGTQTKLFALSATDIVVHKPIKEIPKERM